MHIVFVGRV
jgi:hypothetical protein